MTKNLVVIVCIAYTIEDFYKCVVAISTLKNYYKTIIRFQLGILIKCLEKIT
jgi:hypothetical protein